MAKTPYNVVLDYDWTSIPHGADLRLEAPAVYVTSYLLIANQIQQSILNYNEIIKNNKAKDFYDKMYSETTRKEDDFVFPYFSDNIREFTNTFGDTFAAGVAGQGAIGSNVNESLKKIMSDVVTAIGVKGGEQGVVDIDTPIFSKKIPMNLGKPGVYVETPMFYQFEKSDSAIEVSFVLSNTINPDSLEQNFTLIRRLTEINRPLRQDAITVIPPRIYRVRIPGHRFMRWAYCSHFNVSMLGTRRDIGGRIVPEGYQVTMQFQSLTLEHAGFLDEVGGGVTPIVAPAIANTSQPVPFNNAPSPTNQSNSPVTSSNDPRFPTLSPEERFRIRLNERNNNTPLGPIT